MHATDWKGEVSTVTNIASSYADFHNINSNIHFIYTLPGALFCFVFLLLLFFFFKGEGRATGMEAILSILSKVGGMFLALII